MGSCKGHRAPGPGRKSQAKGEDRSSPALIQPSHEIRILRLENRLVRQKLGRVRSELEVLRTALGDQYAFAPVAYVTLSCDGEILNANLAAFALAGMEGKAFCGQNFGRFIDAGDHEAYLRHLHRLCAGESVAETCDIRFRRPDRQRVDVRLQSVAACGAQGRTREVWSALLDISAFKAAEHKLTLANGVIEAVGDAVVVMDPDGVIESANPTMHDIAHGCDGALLGKPLQAICRADWRTSFDDIWEELHRSGRWSGELTVTGAGCKDIVTWASLAALHGTEGDIEHVAGVLTDLTEVKKAEAQVFWQANHDVVTGLPNRAMFLERLSYLVQQAKRDKKLVGLLFLDLDRFKRINDELGHAVGDTVLEQVARRLSGSVRDSDTVARIGGDEFAIVLPAIESAQGAAFVADKVIHSLKEPLPVGDQKIKTGCSIGIALYPADSEDASELLRYADMAMYRAKKDNRGSYQFYRAEMTEDIRARARLKSELRSAAPNGQLRVDYQPVYDLDSGRLAGMEALLRWRHPRRGWLQPDSFMDLADEPGQSTLLGIWLLDRILADIPVMRVVCGQNPFFLSINVSLEQLTSDMGMEHLLRLARELSAAGVSLVVDVAYSVATATATTTAAMRALSRIQDAGVRIALDHFGMDDSVIGTLMALPFETFKIDRPLVAKLGLGMPYTRLVGGVIAMAHSLNLKVVGVGIETAEQLDILRTAGCDFGQGYLLGRPTDAGGIRTFFSGGIDVPSLLQEKTTGVST